ncbi:PTS sugar transporter subunit IIA [Lignipirellula cremea]|uniref:Putative fructose-like phosphotransferase system subunit EIIA n=1 Tax=Lignipirellula cremea TaxID=2528010 RepID=A0A518E3P2_9BACT|nr:PTS sugar transporter subunit IIA [Lignipirellula cremea]QDU98707.1 putative fructose-like phosphotransferase system subunit EIIA [Lignipirellula cremea]
MSEKEDFDIDSLAAYLHLSPQQVMRMADRAKLPGRKVGGQWRFAQAEIHHWLEERIGASDEEELVEVEDVLQRDNPGMETSAMIELLPPEAIEIPLIARTHRSVISGMAEVAARTGLLWDPEKMAEAVRMRESLHPTALDSGVALLHPRRPLPNILAQTFVALGRTHQGIPFGGGALTDIFFLICSTSDVEHLRILARLSRLVAAPGFVEGLRNADDAAAAAAWLTEFESTLQ